VVLSSTSPLSEADLNTLWTILTVNGGRICRAVHLPPDATHLVALAPGGPLYDQAVLAANVRVVTPDWVVDSAKAGERQNEALYHPRLLLSLPENQRPKPLFAGGWAATGAAALQAVLCIRNDCCRNLDLNFLKVP
jgi:hypothetical protein